MATQTKFRNRITSHLRRNVLAVAALFIVLGGTAVALPGKNTVDSGDIRNKTVKTKDIAKQAVTEKKLADNAVTGAKADEASFQGLVKGDGRQRTVSYTVDAVGFLPQSITLAEVPTMGVVELIACFPETAGSGADIRTRLLSFDDAQPFFGAGTVIGGANPQGTGDGTKTEQMAGMFSAGGGSPLIAEGPNGHGRAGWHQRLLGLADVARQRRRHRRRAREHRGLQQLHDSAAPVSARSRRRPSTRTSQGLGPTQAQAPRRYAAGALRASPQSGPWPGTSSSPEAGSPVPPRPAGWSGSCRSSRHG